MMSRKKNQLNKILNNDYLIFYEKLLKYSKLGPLGFSLCFGIVLFFIHLTASIIQNETNPITIAKDFSFFLSVLNFVGLYLGIIGTVQLKIFIVNLIQLAEETNNEFADKTIRYYRSCFLGRRSIYLGVLFGSFNIIVSLIFGVPYWENAQYFLFGTFLFQVFSIGFIGGLSFNATLIMLKLIQMISQNGMKLNYYHPDKCAGTLVIGFILFMSSINLIIIGVLIFIFMSNFEWSYQMKQSEHYYTEALMIFWKTFTFVLAGLLFIIPAKKINFILKKYKQNEQLNVKTKIIEITNMIINISSNDKDSALKMSILNNRHEKLNNLNQEINGINTWPYNLKYKTTFLSIFLPVVIGIILELSKSFISGIFN